jgi:16S rRNA (uracil1498-N3)-methyltransferase
MSLHRFFLTAPLADNDPALLPLSDADAHHAVAVLRVRAGEEIEVVEPAPVSALWRVRVVEVAADDERGWLVAERVTQLASRPVGPFVTLFQGVAKGEKMDVIVRQAVEVGAAEIVPILSARSVVKLDERKAAERGSRWRRIAESAAKQSHRLRVPDVSDPIRFADALALLSAYDAAVVLWEEHRGRGIASVLASVGRAEGSRIALVIGPEGGFSAEEIASLEGSGVVPASLGPTILRTETAAVAALAIAVHELGGLGGRS